MPTRLLKLFNTINWALPRPRPLCPWRRAPAPRTPALWTRPWRRCTGRAWRRSRPGASPRTASPPACGARSCPLWWFRTSPAWICPLRPRRWRPGRSLCSCGFQEKVDYYERKWIMKRVATSITHVRDRRQGNCYRFFYHNCYCNYFNSEWLLLTISKWKNVI